MIEVRQVRRHIPGIPLGGGSILPRGRLPEVSPEVKVTRMSRDMWSVARDRIFLGSSPPPLPSVVSSGLDLPHADAGGQQQGQT